MLHLIFFLTFDLLAFCWNLTLAFCRFNHYARWTLLNDWFWISLLNDIVICNFPVQHTLVALLIFDALKSHCSLERDGDLDFLEEDGNGGVVLLFNNYFFIKKKWLVLLIYFSICPFTYSFHSKEDIAININSWLMSVDLVSHPLNHVEARSLYKALWMN